MSALLSLVATNALTAGALALLAWMAGRTLKRQAVVHGLWLLALVKLVTPPLVPMAVLPAWSALLPAPAAPVTALIRTRAVPATPASLAGPGATASGILAAGAPDLHRPAAGAAPATPLPLEHAPAAVAGLLALGTLAVGSITFWRARRFRRLLSSATPAPEAVRRRAAQIAASLGLPAAPPVLLVPAAVPPMLWPARRGPLLLLPRPLLTRLSADERDALLAHELAHVRRRDHWVRFVEIAATALFWWYPVAWWARRALRRAEERCCDEWVLRVLPSSADAYASGLLKSLAFVSGEIDPLPAGASGAGPVQDLEARLKEILMTRPLPRLAAPVRLGLAAAAMVGLAVFPTRAQSRAVAEAAVVAAGATAPSPDAAPVAARSVAARPVVAGPVGVVAPRDVRPLVALSPLRGSVGAASAGLSLDSSDTEDPALAAERRALDEQRRKLREQEIDLERRTLELEARANQKRLTDEVARLRAEGHAAEAERSEKQVRLDARRIELQKQMLQLGLESGRLEAQMDAAAHGLEQGTSAGEAEMERARQALESKQQALQAEMEKAEQQMQALEAEGRVEDLRQSTGELERSLAEQIQSLQEALPEAGAQKAELEHEIQRLRSALDALGSPSTGTRMRSTAPRERMRTRQPEPPPAQP